MSEWDRLRCTLRETQERVTELEVRLSLVEDKEEYEYEHGDVTIEDWPQDAEEAFEDIEAELEEVWTDEDEAELQASLSEEMRKRGGG